MQKQKTISAYRFLPGLMKKTYLVFTMLITLLLYNAPALAQCDTEADFSYTGPTPGLDGCTYTFTADEDGANSIHFWTVWFDNGLPFTANGTGLNTITLTVPVSNSLDMVLHWVFIPGEGSFSCMDDDFASCTNDCDTLDYFEYTIEDCDLVSFAALVDDSEVDTYHWDFGDGSSSNLAYTLHQYNTSGSFVVTLTITWNDGSVTSCSEEIEITCDDNHCVEAAIFDYHVDSCTVTFVPEAISLPACWDLGDGTVITTPTTGIVVHTYPDTNGDTVCYDVTRYDCNVPTTDCIKRICVSCGENTAPLCCPADGINLTGYTISEAVDDELIPSGSLRDTSVCVEPFHTLVIDEDYSFINVEFFMDEGSRILLPQENSLQISGSHLHGCDRMWVGIVVEEGARLFFSSDSIEDAQYAIEAQAGSNVSIRGNVFDRNYVSLYGPGGDFNHSIHLNSHQCSDELLPPYAGQDPEPAEVSYAGILLHNFRQGALTVGYANPSPQLPATSSESFLDLANGIIAWNSNLNIRTARFDNMVIENMYDYSSFGIRADGKNRFLVQRGLGNQANPSPPITGSGVTATFDACRHGIWTSGMHVDITRSKMTNVETGIHTQLATKRDVNIYENAIAASLDGMNLINNYSANVFDIRNNYLEVGPYNGDKANAGIHVIGYNPWRGVNTFNRGAITKNELHVFNGDHPVGIVVKDVQLPETRTDPLLSITDNDVTIANDNATTIQASGISLFDSHRLYVNCNTVAGQTLDCSNVDPNNGIFIENVEYTVLECNTINTSMKALHYVGACMDNDLFTTDFGDNCIGLHMDATATFGGSSGNNVQSHHGNRWNGSYAWNAAVHDGGFDQIIFSKFEVHTTNAPFWPPTIATPNTSEPWFDHIPGGTPDSCATSEDCGIPQELPPLVVTKMDSLIASGHVLTDTFANSLYWLNSQQLYRKLYSDTSLIVAGSNIDSFYTQAADTSLGALHAVAVDMAGLFVVDSAMLADYDSLLADYYLMLDSLGQTEYELSKASGQDSLDLEAQKDSLFADMELLADNYEAWHDSISPLQYSAADDVLVDNNKISVTVDYEKNEKQVNKVFLKNLAKDTVNLTTLQITTLGAIAFQCPLEGGKSVRRARALFRLAFPDVVFGDSLCVGAGSSSRKKHIPEDQSLTEEEMVKEDSKKESTGIVKLFPNPVQDELTVQYQSTGELTLTLFDLNGKLIATYALDSTASEKRINIAHIDNGLYLYKVHDQNGAVTSGKITVLR